MKKTLLPVLALAGLLAACNGKESAEDAAKREEMRHDSIAAVDKQVKDALDQRLKEMQDSISAVAKATNEKMEEQVQ